MREVQPNMKGNSDWDFCSKKLEEGRGEPSYAQCAVADTEWKLLLLTLFNLRTDLLPRSGAHMHEETWDCEGVSILYSNVIGIFNSPYKFSRDCNATRVITNTRSFEKRIMETSIPSIGSTGAKQRMQHFISTQPMQKSLISNKSYTAIPFP